MTTTTAYPHVTVPARILGTLVTTILQGAIDRGQAYEREQDALRRLVDHCPTFDSREANDSEALMSLPADVLFAVTHASSALSTYDLDETAGESYENPAVLAELRSEETLIRQAPEAHKALDDQETAELLGGLS